MNTQENEKDLEKAEELKRLKAEQEAQKKQEEEDNETSEERKGDGYVPPAPEIPSARNTREHGGPIIDREPGGLR
ncbi:hypothetical protein [Sphingobacterium pedocola]|uniref:Uncharacterized protein n=1 Tax=Sphingobacterium pedocola TaxID=2082722 RepID=A0ABR9T6P4_9SPHI|nr:hypothetical protein [Sphingobacterium pedocola]MBE8721021.1 hypothetical protein [Sphingobacterium pedocola]